MKFHLSTLLWLEEEMGILGDAYLYLQTISKFLSIVQMLCFISTVYVSSLFYVRLLLFFGLGIEFEFLLLRTYSQVSITSEDKREVNVKAIGRKIIEKLYETYSSEFSGKMFAYDGEKSLYTVGPLPENKSEFTVLLEGSFAKKYVVHALLFPSLVFESFFVHVTLC